MDIRKVEGGGDQLPPPAKVKTTQIGEKTETARQRVHGQLGKTLEKHFQYPKTLSQVVVSTSQKKLEVSQAYFFAVYKEDPFKQAVAKKALDLLAPMMKGNETLQKKVYQALHLVMENGEILKPFSEYLDLALQNRKDNLNRLAQGELVTGSTKQEVDADGKRAMILMGIHGKEGEGIVTSLLMSIQEYTALNNVQICTDVWKNVSFDSTHKEFKKYRGTGIGSLSEDKFSPEEKTLAASGHLTRDGLLFWNKTEWKRTDSTPDTLEEGRFVVKKATNVIDLVIPGVAAHRIEIKVDLTPYLPTNPTFQQSEALVSFLDQWMRANPGEMEKKKDFILGTDLTFLEEKSFKVLIKILSDLKGRPLDLRKIKKEQMDTIMPKGLTDAQRKAVFNVLQQAGQIGLGARKQCLVEMGTRFRERLPFIRGEQYNQLIQYAMEFKGTVFNQADVFDGESKQWKGKLAGILKIWNQVPEEQKKEVSQRVLWVLEMMINAPKKAQQDYAQSLESGWGLRKPLAFLSQDQLSQFWNYGSQLAKEMQQKLAYALMALADPKVKPEKGFFIDVTKEVCHPLVTQGIQETEEILGNPILDAKLLQELNGVLRNPKLGGAYLNLLKALQVAYSKNSEVKPPLGEKNFVKLQHNLRAVYAREKLGDLKDFPLVKKLIQEKLMEVSIYQWVEIDQVAIKALLQLAKDVLKGDVWNKSLEDVHKAAFKKDPKGTYQTLKNLVIAVLDAQEEERKDQRKELRTSDFEIV